MTLRARFACHMLTLAKILEHVDSRRDDGIVSPWVP